jgi:hypothetical protein
MMILPLSSLGHPQNMHLVLAGKVEKGDDPQIRTLFSSKRVHGLPKILYVSMKSVYVSMKRVHVSVERAFFSA